MISNEEYLKESVLICPVCKSMNISADNIEVDGMQAWSNCCCKDCGSEWSDEYSLVRYDNVIEKR